MRAKNCPNCGAEYHHDGEDCGKHEAASETAKPQTGTGRGRGKGSKKAKEDAEK